MATQCLCAHLAWSRRREDEGRRRRFRRREGGTPDEDGPGPGSIADSDHVAEEDGYGAFCSQARSEEIYHDLCALHLPPADQVRFVRCIYTHTHNLRFPLTFTLYTFFSSFARGCFLRSH